MRTRQRTNLTPDRADFSSLTTIQTLTFVKDRTAHGFFFYIVVVTVDQRTLFVQLFFRELSFEFFTDSFESSKTFVFVIVSGSGNSVSFFVACFTNSLAQIFVVHFMVVFTFHCFSNLFSQLHLCFTMNLDSFMSYFHCFQQFSFGYFVHFTFYHHDVLISSGHHQIHISFFQLFKSRIDNELTVDTCYTYFRNRSVERNI